MPQPKPECQHDYQEMIVKNNQGLQASMVNGRPYVEGIMEIETELRCTKCGQLCPEPVSEIDIDSYDFKF